VTFSPFVGPGGIRASKLRLFLSLPTKGVRVIVPPIPGVLHATWAGDGVTFRKSLKLKPTPGVAAPIPRKCAADPPGVDSIEDGKGVFCCGGVEGGFTILDDWGGTGVRGLWFRDGTAGDGDAAKNIKRSAASSELREVAFANGLDLRRADLATSGDGVRGMWGGEDWIWRGIPWKEAKGRSESSSSEAERSTGSSAIVVSVINEDIIGRFGWGTNRRTGEDSGSWWFLFHEVVCDDTALLARPWLAPFVKGCGALYFDFERLELLLLPDKEPDSSSEKRGAVKGEEFILFRRYVGADTVDDVSDKASLCELEGRFRLSSCSIRGSRDSNGRFPQPFWTLTFAKANRFWRALVIYSSC
jgi:hypothetical protein